MSSMAGWVDVAMGEVGDTTDTLISMIIGGGMAEPTSGLLFVLLSSEEDVESEGEGSGARRRESSSEGM